MNTKTNSSAAIRYAYIARKPGRLGASAYLSVEAAHTDAGRAVIDEWLKHGSLVERVPLHHAIEQLSLYLKERSSPEDFPRFFLKQAD